MDFHYAAAGATPAAGAPPFTDATEADPVPVQPLSDASRCVSCRVRELCLGGVAAQAGTTQLRDVLAGRRRLQAGEALYRPGERFVYLYAVRSGSLKSAVQRADGEHVLGFHLPGELVGVDALASGRHAHAATALEDSEVCAVRYPAARAGTVSGARAFAGRLWEMLGREIVRDREHTTLLVTRTGTERVSTFLASLAGRMRERGYASREFHLRMSRAEIGSFLGVSLETVSRALSVFARRGLIEVHRKHIRIVDPDGLQGETQARAGG